MSVSTWKPNRSKHYSSRAVLTPKPRLIFFGMPGLGNFILRLSGRKILKFVKNKNISNQCLFSEEFLYSEIQGDFHLNSLC